MSYFSGTASLAVLYGNFMIECQYNFQTGNSQLRAAKKLGLDPVETYIIFVREKEYMQKVHSQAGGAESAVDLVSYVEFQRNFRWAPRSACRLLFWCIRAGELCKCNARTQPGRWRGERC